MTTQNILNYRVTGEGYPVVFLHGFLESNSMWESISTKLTGLQSICIELYGHGNSPNFKGSLSIKAIAEGVLQVIKKERIKKFAIVGHSLGGYVAIELQSLLSNSTCTHLILLNSHPWKDSTIKKNERTQVANIVRKNKSLFIKQAIPNLFKEAKDHPDSVKKLITEALSIDAESIANTTLAMRDRVDTSSILLKMKEKLLIIQGEHDKLIPISKMKKFADENGFKLAVLSEAGHMSHIECESKVIQLIKSFIQL